MKLLHVDSSITGPRSVSRELSALIVEKLRAAQGLESVYVYRDLVAEDLPHFTAITAPSAHPIAKTVPALSAAQQVQRDTSDTILKEFIEADIVVVGAPLYNFALPSALKAWVDRLLVPGTTFRYGPNGPEGLAGNKRVILAIARGGVYSEPSTLKSIEHAESFLRVALGFIGVKNVETVVAEGLNVADIKEKAIASARDAVQRLAA
ncbi:FMN-dependent NADH-azoreductase [Trinickia diaoshuihuensis]|jgi:FMN-dependent NADH-azoreductase|uniref:FMN-dependent NADH-azoreductase n=1 Tax=Trinickia diaoshuihuensis TaxID=2292265 RepID=UPI000E22B054|nr:NAD(P)H-dependent oxidoreductase [Trinickia diaoshuihuensis]